MNEHLAVEQYEKAERALSAEEARRGFAIHATVVTIVAAVLISVNVTLAREFPWSGIATIGMGVGLAVHYLFGIRWLGRFVEARQREAERRAARLGEP